MTLIDVTYSGVRRGQRLFRPSAFDSRKNRPVTHPSRSNRPARTARGRIYGGFKDRPEPDFRLDPLHKALLVFSTLLAVVMPIYFWLQTTHMDGTLPMHYNTAGEVTREGSVVEAGITVTVLGLLVIGLVLLSRYPRIFNYPTMLTEHNVQRQYKTSVQMMAWTSVGSAGIMVVMTGNWLGWLSMNWVWLPLGIMIGAVVWCIARMIKQT